MKWLAGPVGGGWHDLAQGLAGIVNEEMPGVDIVVIGGGGSDNPRMIQNGEGQIGMSVDFLIAAAFRGQSPYGPVRMTNINTLGRGWSPLPFHLLCAEGVPRDLREAIARPRLRIAVPPKDTSDELTFRRVMDFYRVSYEAIERNGGLVFHGSYDVIADALRQGHVDYLFGATTKPAKVIRSIGEGDRTIALAAMPPDLMKHLADQYGYGTGIIAGDTYPKLQTGDIETTFMDTVLMISADVVEDHAYRIATILLKRHARLAAKHPCLASFDPRTAWRHAPAPLHPGAERAYRDFGCFT